MRYKTNWVDVQYDAVFRVPLFALAGNPVSVLSAVHSKLSTKWSIPGSDLIVDGGRAVSDVRARVSLFAGNGTLEFGSEMFTAKFINPSVAGDTEIIKDCISLVHEALASLSGGKNDFREEGITVRLFIEVESGDAPAFLRDLYGDSKLFVPVDLPGGAEVVPGFRIEFLQDDLKCVFQFEVTRAHRSRKELFVTTGARFYNGSSLVTLDQKSEHMRTLVRTAFARAGLEPQSTEKK